MKYAVKPNFVTMGTPMPAALVMLTALLAVPGQLAAMGQFALNSKSVMTVIATIETGAAMIAPLPGAATA